MKQAEQNKLIAQMNHLYITNRKNFLQQSKNSYATMKYTLHDGIVREHLEGKRTIGIKLGTQGLTKFQTWDIDYPEDDEKAKAVTIKLIKALNEYWGIPLDEIHIDFSGSKGYHVTLFYDKVVPDVTLYPFYKEVIDYIGQSEKQVEFRCSSKYGMKLPLGINKKSQKFMCFMEYNPQSEQLKKMSKKNSYQYFSGIQQSSLEEFKELVFSDVEAKKSITFTGKEGQDFEEVMEEINTDGKSVEELERELITVLNNGRLSYLGSRNRITFLLSMFFMEQGYELEESVELIQKIMLNTWKNYRELISKDTTEGYMLSEIDRVVKNTYQKNYSLSSRRKDVVLHKWEIMQLLDIKEYHLKKLMFVLLIHSKRYAKKNNIFYMAYSTMNRMGCTDNRNRLLKYLNILEDRGLMKIESQNMIDKIQSRIKNAVIKEPNKYQVLLKRDVNQEQLEGTITLKSNEEMTLEQVTSLLIEEKYAKKKLPRKQFLHFKEEYIKNAV